MAECDELKVERQVDLTAVEVVGCSISKRVIAPDEQITLQATITNPNDVAVFARAGWFASDLQHIGIGASDRVLIQRGQNVGVSTTFIPNEDDQVVSIVGEDGEWRSVVNSFVFPSSVEVASEVEVETHGTFGLSRTRQASAGAVAVRSDGGCTSCGQTAQTAAQTRLTDRVNRGTLASAGLGVGAGAVALALR